jgi:hypothetical protein
LKHRVRVTRTEVAARLTEGLHFDDGAVVGDESNVKLHFGVDDAVWAALTKDLGVGDMEEGVVFVDMLVERQRKSICSDGELP